MKVKVIETNEEKDVLIKRVTRKELKVILKEKHRFKFDWADHKGQELYKLTLKEDKQILGIMAITDHIDASINAIEISLLEVGAENVGSEKIIDNIAGCLIAFACRESFKRDHNGMVFLVPKSTLVKHYSNKYGFTHFPFQTLERPEGIMEIEGEAASRLTILIIKKIIMKPHSEEEKKLTSEELAESFVFPVDLTKGERRAVLDEFRAIRGKIASKETPESKMRSQLLKLKFTIEDYLESSNLNKVYFFGAFLKSYIDCQNKNNKEFAREIDVNPTELSQIINRHRKPTEKLIYRLEIHSNKNFPAIVWFGILEKDREYELFTDSSIIENERKYVKSHLPFRFKFERRK